MGLRDRSIRGIRATLAGTITGAVLQMATLVVLARLLTPRDYGAYAACLVLMQPLQMASLSTTERALVIQGAVSDYTIAAVQGVMFWIMSALSLSIGICGCFLWLFMGKDMGAVFAAYAPVLPIATLASMSRAKLRLDMRFEKIVVVDLVGQLIGTAGSTILAAYFGLGAFSLVVGAVTLNTIQMWGYRYRENHSWRVAFDFPGAKTSVKMAYHVAKISYLEIIQGQIPSIFIGSILGTVALGLFSRAYSLVQLPIELLTNAITRVLYSSFVAIRDDREKYRAAFYQLVECSTVIIFPVALGMAVAAPQLVRVILGEQWLEDEPLIAWLTVGAALTMAGTVFSNAVETALHLKAKFHGQLSALIGGISIFAVLTNTGLLGASIAFTISWFVYFSLFVWLAYRLLELDRSKLFASLMPGVAGGLAVVVYVYIVRIWLTFLPQGLLFLVEIAGCGLVLTAVVRYLFPRLFWLLTSYSGVDRFLRRSAGEA
jgi:O-antigen/teichoic acid export membrane protein